MSSEASSSSGLTARTAGVPRWATANQAGGSIGVADTSLNQADTGDNIRTSLQGDQPPACQQLVGQETPHGPPVPLGVPVATSSQSYPDTPGITNTASSSQDPHSGSSTSTKPTLEVKSFLSRARIAASRESATPTKAPNLGAVSQSSGISINQTTDGAKVPTRPPNAPHGSSSAVAQSPAPPPLSNEGSRASTRRSSAAASDAARTDVEVIDLTEEDPSVTMAEATASTLATASPPDTRSASQPTSPPAPRDTFTSSVLPAFVTPASAGAMLDSIQLARSSKTAERSRAGGGALVQQLPQADRPRRQSMPGRDGGVMPTTLPSQQETAQMQVARPAAASQQHSHVSQQQAQQQQRAEHQQAAQQQSQQEPAQRQQIQQQVQQQQQAQQTSQRHFHQHQQPQQPHTQQQHAPFSQVQQQQPLSQSQPGHPRPEITPELVGPKLYDQYQWFQQIMSQPTQSAPPTDNTPMPNPHLRPHFPQPTHQQVPANTIAYNQAYAQRQATARAPHMQSQVHTMQIGRLSRSPLTPYDTQSQQQSHQQAAQSSYGQTNQPWSQAQQLNQQNMNVQPALRVTPSGPDSLSAEVIQRSQAALSSCEQIAKDAVDAVTANALASFTQTCGTLAESVRNHIASSFASASGSTSEVLGLAFNELEGLRAKLQTSEQELRTHKAQTQSSLKPLQDLVRNLMREKDQLKTQLQKAEQAKAGAAQQRELLVAKFADQAKQLEQAASDAKATEQKLAEQRATLHEEISAELNTLWADRFKNNTSLITNLQKEKDEAVRARIKAEQELSDLKNGSTVQASVITRLRQEVQQAQDTANQANAKLKTTEANCIKQRDLLREREASIQETRKGEQQAKADLILLQRAFEEADKLHRTARATLQERLDAVLAAQKRPGSEVKDKDDKIILLMDQLEALESELEQLKSDREKLQKRLKTQGEGTGSSTPVRASQDSTTQSRELERTKMQLLHLVQALNGVWEVASAVQDKRDVELNGLPISARKTNYEKAKGVEELLRMLASRSSTPLSPTFALGKRRAVDSEGPANKRRATWHQSRPSLDSNGPPASPSSPEGIKAWVKREMDKKFLEPGTDGILCKLCRAEDKIRKKEGDPDSWNLPAHTSKEHQLQHILENHENLLHTIIARKGRGRGASVVSPV